MATVESLVEMITAVSSAKQMVMNAIASLARGDMKGACEALRGARHVLRHVPVPDSASHMASHMTRFLEVAARHIDQAASILSAKEQPGSHDAARVLCHVSAASQLLHAIESAVLEHVYWITGQ